MGFVEFTRAKQTSSDRDPPATQAALERNLRRRQWSHWPGHLDIVVIDARGLQ